MNSIMNLPKIDLHGKEVVELVSNFAPFLTPIGPATVAILGMSHGLSESMGFWGVLPAFGSGLGMEGTGYLASYLLMRGIRRGSFASSFLSALFLFAYAAFAVAAIGEIKNAGIFQWFVCMSIACYLVVGLYTYENKQELERRQTQQDEIDAKKKDLEIKQQELALYERGQEIERARKEIELRVMQERTKQARASARSNGHPVPVRSVSSEQPNSELDPTKLAHARAFFEANPRASARAWLKSDGCPVTSPESASKYRKAVQP